MKGGICKLVPVVQIVKHKLNLFRDVSGENSIAMALTENM